jgi:hypothetical protein
MLTTTDIEMMSKNILERNIISSKVLTSFIDSNDKTPSWDGSIFVSKINKLKKSNIERIPVQLKGTLVTSLSSKKFSYPFNIDDLRNYLNDGGVLYFVITMKTINKYRIFYLDLLPYDINKILKTVKKGQKTKSLSLKLLNESSPKYLEAICNNFLLHRKKQYSTVDQKIIINNTTKYSGNLIVPYNINFEKFLFDSELYLYAQNDDFSVPIPIDKIKLDSLSKNLNKEISIENKIYFNNYSVIKKVNENYIQIGKGIRIYFDLKTNRNRIQFTNKGMLNDQLKDVEFMLDFYSYKYISIDGIHIVDNLIVDNTNLNTLKKLHKDLKDTARLLEFFNIKKDLDVNNLGDNEISHLNILIKIILYNKNIEMESCTKGFVQLKLSNINILVFIDLNSNNIIKIKDLFSPESDNLVTIFTTTENTTFKNSRFLNLKGEYIIDIDNLDLKVIENSIKSFSMDENNLGVVNNFALELIKGYDLNNNLNGFLTTSLNLLKWIYKSYPVSYIYINICQVLKILTNTSDENIEKLIDIKVNEDNINIKFAASILLDSKTEANYFFNKLSTEEQNNIKDYPIYTLYKNMQ